MAGTFTKLLFHVIYSTKGRSSCIDAEIETRLYQYIGGAVRSEGGMLHEIGGTSDHLHLLIELKANTSVAAALKKIKGSSSHWLRSEVGNTRWLGWQKGYAAFSVSESQLPSVRRYVQRQKEHHRKHSFRDELVDYLRKHEIEFEEGYLLG